jgi:hypothetical protein
MLGQAPQQTTSERYELVDVHSPHQPLHTWKDFWIHLATISIGLLIALGLEASVEGIHHLHQRHQLEDDLHAEAVKNIAAMKGDFRYIDAWMAYLTALRKDVDTMHASGGKTKIPFRLFANPNGGVALTRPSSSSWTTAKESALVDLLPREEAKFYDRVYFELQLYDGAYTNRNEIINEVNYFEARFAPVTLAPISPDLSLMSMEQLDQFSALLAKNLVVNRYLRNRLDYFYAAETAVVNNDRSEDDVLKYLNVHQAVGPSDQPATAPAP